MWINGFLDPLKSQNVERNWPKIKQHYNTESNSWLNKSFQKISSFALVHVPIYKLLINCKLLNIWNIFHTGLDARLDTQRFTKE